MPSDIESSSVYHFDTTTAMDSFMDNYDQEYNYLPTNLLSCIECPGSSFSTPLDLFSHQQELHWPGEASLGYEYEGSTIQPSQLLVDNSFQAGGLVASYPEYPGSSIFESGENSPLSAAEAPEPGTPASSLDQAVNTTHTAAKPSSARGLNKPPTVLCSSPGCGKRFATKQVMETHVAEVHEQIKIPCDQPGCNETCANKENLARHKKSVHDRVRFPCPNVGCTYTSTRRDNLKSRHLPVCQYPA